MMIVSELCLLAAPSISKEGSFCLLPFPMGVEGYQIWGFPQRMAGFACIVIYQPSLRVPAETGHLQLAFRNFKVIVHLDLLFEPPGS